jgi:hypothetical protein
VPRSGGPDSCRSSVVLGVMGRENAGQKLRTGRPLQPIAPSLELVGDQGGHQGAGRAEQDPGGGVGEPVGREVGAGARKR